MDPFVLILFSLNLGGNYKCVLFLLIKMFLLYLINETNDSKTFWKLWLLYLSSKENWHTTDACRSETTTTLEMIDPPWIICKAKEIVIESLVTKSLLPPYHVQPFFSSFASEANPRILEARLLLPSSTGGGGGGGCSYSLTPGTWWCSADVHQSRSHIMSNWKPSLCQTLHKRCSDMFHCIPNLF